MKRFLKICLLLNLALISDVPADDGRMVPVTLQLRRGGFIEGSAAEFDQDGLVLEVGPDLAAINWDDVKTSSAYQARKKILASIRGSGVELIAEDHFQLGRFLASRDSHRAAIGEFRQAEKLDPGFKLRIEQAWREVRRAKESNKRYAITLLSEEVQPSQTSKPIGRQEDTRHATAYLQTSEQQHRDAIELYKTFGEKVRETVAPNLVLLETQHFLIWTDWPEHYRDLIPRWAEQMYVRLCNEFGFAKEEPIWRGKCPIFCFKSKARFDKFAKTIDQYDSGTTLGYTKTSDNGYAHVVLRRLGNQPADIDQFATTMVHEASHAFMHAYGSPRPLPPWLSEGWADYIAEQVLGNHCRAAENAAAVARQYVYRNKSIKKLFQAEEDLPALNYPLAQSLVSFLIQRDHVGFIDLINDLKSGMVIDEALSKNFKGMTTKDLERLWEQAILQAYPPK